MWWSSYTTPAGLAAAASARGDHTNYSRDVSSRFRWRERAAAYDEHMERVAVEAERAERKAMAARHLAIGLAGQEKLAKALADLTDADAYDMVVKKPGEAWRLLEGAVRLERESRGVTPAERDESGQGTAGVQLARAYLMHDEARQKMLESFDLLMAATVDGRRPVLDAWTGEPLD